MKLYNVIKQLIFEASSEEITNAIKNRNVATIYYDGEDNGGKGLRVIEPFCYGTSKRGNKVIRAWEREGASHTATIGDQPLPGWRLFRVDRIGSFSSDPREKFDIIRPSYNPEDKGMVGLKVCTKFELENE
jgi:hypothetical protein